MTLRIAHMIQRYPPALGGAESYFARLSRHLAARGDQVTVFTTNADDLEAFWSPRGRSLPAGATHVDGVEVRRFAINHWPGRRYLVKALSLIPSLPLQRLALPCNPISLSMWRAVNRDAGPFEVVHASAFPYTWPIVCGLRLARRLGVPFCLTPFLHLGDPARPDDPTRRAYLSRPLVSLLREADLIFAQTASERAAILDQGLPPDRVILQGLGVDAAECSGGARWEVRQAWGAAPDELIVGHLANKSEEKGTVDLLRAAEILWKEGKQFRVVLAGPEMSNFLRFWPGFDCKNCVIRLGVLTDQEKRDFYAGIDLFALPSRSDSFGLVLLEAWANEVPNIAYRAGGIGDVIRHGEDGWLAPCGNVAELAEGLRNLIHHREMRERFGIAGRIRTEHEFRWPDKLDLVATAYDRLHARTARSFAQNCDLTRASAG